MIRSAEELPSLAGAISQNRGLTRGVLLGLFFLILTMVSPPGWPLWPLALDFFIFFILLFVFGVWAYFTSQRPPWPKGKLFPGPGETSPKRPWNRTQTDEIVKCLRDSGSSARAKERACAIFGPSGAGKSTMIRAHVMKKLVDAGWEIVLYPDPDKGTSYAHEAEFRQMLTQEIAALSGESLSDDPSDWGKLTFQGKKVAFIFDQAEQLSIQSENAQNWIRECLNKIRAIDESRILFSIREDFYLRMRFLRDTLPCHKDLIYIPGFNPQNDSDKNEVRQLLNQVCEPDVVTVIVNDLRSASSSVSSNLTGTTGVILPVDLAIVGLMIEISHLFRERGKLRYREAYEVTLGGKDGLVRSYLRTCLQASPDYYVSQAVLAALSAATGLRSAVGIQKLCQVVYYRDDDVEKAIEFFEERGLVRRFATKSGEAAYEWTHDTLAAAYREFSASEMDATLRDNIMYLAERATTGKEEIQTYCALEKNIIKWRLWLSVYVLVCAGVVLRWVWPGPFDSAAVQLRQWDVVRSLFPNPTSPDDAAKLYMWVGWSHLAGGWFVYKILNLFIHVRGKISYLPFVIGLVGFLLVLVTGIFPRLWLISIGIEALLIGCTFLWMLMWADIAKAARMQVGELGAVCTLMSLALFGGGWWQIQYWQPDQAGEWGLPAGFAILISIWAVYSAARSGSRQAMARFLGALDRSPIGSRPTASGEVGMANSGTRQVVGSQVPDNHNAYDRTVRGRKGIKGDKLR